mmetsp:Transcript_16512/g.66688  ORF Transcript_16512/g.66688 Transcript_16512/m.66688 type:complete len:101 (+) Transcript_16512:262-564(+)
MHDAFKAAGIDHIYGVSVDSPAKNAAFAEKYAFAFPLLCDVDKAMTKAFECCRASGDDPCAMASRICVVVDARGTISKLIAPFDAREGPASLLSDLKEEL